MATLYQYTLWLHASAGMFGLAVFWVPVVLRKGSNNHKRVGRWYLRLMMLAALTGLGIALMMIFQPLIVSPPPANFSPEQIAGLAAQTQQRAGFFFLLAFLLIATTQRARLSLIARADRRLLRKPVHLLAPVALIVSASYLAWMGIAGSSTLYLVFAGIGLFIGPSLLWYAFKPTLAHGEWVVEHLGSTIGSGIAAHTAFFVFGAASVLGELFRGQLVLLPWVLPSVVGATAIVVLSRRYKQRLGIGRFAKVRSQTKSGAAST